MKQYIYLLCALLGIGLYSCSHEETALEGTSNRITVSFNLPDTDSDTRADATTEATDEEKALHQVDLYCFDYADGKIGTLKSITHLSNPANADNNISLGVGTYHIEAIANESSLNLTEGSSSYEDFLKLRATSGDYDSWSTTGGIKMQGSQKTKVTNGTASMNINFTMIRMVGRIDVVNKVPGLTITKALLENSVIESFYLEDTESTIAQEEGKTGDFTAIGLSVAPDASARIFYAYEGAVEHSKLQVSFEGTDANGTLHSSLPIVEFTNQNAQPAIKRNKLYVVTLEEVDGSVEATVTVSDWNQKNIDAEVSVDDGNDILIHGDEGEDIDIKNNGNNQYTLYVPAKAATYTLNIDNVNIELEAGETPDVNWMSLTAVDTRALNQSLKLTVEENTDSDNQRTAKFEIYSKLDGKVVATCTVVQEKAEKPEPEPELIGNKSPA